ncbi:NADP-dependent oxidoreductase [Aestuariispira insulae]|uniref:Enoyl reductase (ER) domain-containing protein n=1 Tax=Aestuariispira insulae TaxID=1461337 RepID=A0A3D9HLG7_9PROT|nr:NADP-dependent oxidoreductase [Aestuariispira insulae]RED49736.1 hypothetical protein DFP90_105107 [Aestuariispira insulae]
MESNRQWVLASYPNGMPERTNWRLEEGVCPSPLEGEVLARSIYLSVDPYMRGRISPAKNYAAGVAIGECMHGGAVAEVVESKHPGFQPGDIVETINFGWQDFACLKGDGLHKVDPTLGPIHSALGYLGLPGLTAYLALETIGEPKQGETVLISAASGAVGQIAGQIATIRGARAVAVASSQEKLDYCRDLGFADGINYREETDLAAAVRRACPDGVDVFFDNTAGPIHDAVMQNLAPFARIIICGTVSLAGKFDEPDTGLRFMRNILVARARMEGFLFFDHLDKVSAARKQVSDWEKQGLIRHREDVIDGIEHMPEAFLRLLNSENFGKQLVRVRDDPFL